MFYAAFGAHFMIKLSKIEAEFRSVAYKKKCRYKAEQHLGHLGYL